MRYIGLSPTELQEGRLAFFVRLLSSHITVAIVGNGVDTRNAVYSEHIVDDASSSIPTSKVKKESLFNARKENTHITQYVVLISQQTGQLCLLASVFYQSED